MRKPIGYVLRCESADVGEWYDFRDTPLPGWTPVVPQADPAIEKMATVMYDTHDKVWKARAKGSNAWAVADTVWEAVGLAALQPDQEEPLW